MLRLIQTIEIKLEDGVRMGKVNISLFDITGRLILKELSSLEKGVEKVNTFLGKAGEGVYLLEVEINDQKSRVQIIKK